MDFEKSIVYFQTRSEVVEAWIRLREWATNNDKDKITYYHAILSTECKSDIVKRFKSGMIRILLSTEAAGMGCDISDVIRVVQFKCPRDLPSLIQRLGRASRDPTLSGSGILLIPSRLPVVGSVDPDLLAFITSKDCRRKVLNTVFGNEHQLVDNCCDQCNREPELESKGEEANNIPGEKGSPTHTTNEKEI
ncbi:ATP-dependent DNA helicase Q4, partial [Modicella reniformis]